MFPRSEPKLAELPFFGEGRFVLSAQAALALGRALQSRDRLTAAMTMAWSGNSNRHLAEMDAAFEKAQRADGYVE